MIKQLFTLFLFNFFTIKFSFSYFLKFHSYQNYWIFLISIHYNKFKSGSRSALFVNNVIRKKLTKSQIQMDAIFHEEVSCLT